MRTETTTTNILDEEFEIPVLNSDLEETIEKAIEYYNSMPYCRKTTKDFRHKLNEIINTYNDKRGMKIYNHI